VPRVFEPRETSKNPVFLQLFSELGQGPTRGKRENVAILATHAFK
jgi:hypothetical protein